MAKEYLQPLPFRGGGLESRLAFTLSLDLSLRMWWKWWCVTCKPRPQGLAASHPAQLPWEKPRPPARWMQPPESRKDQQKSCTIDPQIQEKQTSVVVRSRWVEASYSAVVCAPSLCICDLGVTPAALGWAGLGCLGWGWGWVLLKSSSSMETSLSMFKIFFERKWLINEILRS